jgi:hypothetical protein
VSNVEKAQDSYKSHMEGTSAVSGLHFASGAREVAGGGSLCDGGKDSIRGVQMWASLRDRVGGGVRRERGNGREEKGEWDRGQEIKNK